MTNQAIDGDDDSDGAPGDRIWASQWYRITPRSFVHVELFFDPERIIYAFAGESYKSILLRQDGREQRAEELGAQYRDRSATELLADDRHEATQLPDIDAIELSSGSLLRKPELTIQTVDNDRDRTFYHFSRRHDPTSLGEQLVEHYPSVTVTIDGEKME